MIKTKAGNPVRILGTKGGYLKCQMEGVREPLSFRLDELVADSEDEIADALLKAIEKDLEGLTVRG